MRELLTITAIFFRQSSHECAHGFLIVELLFLFLSLSLLFFSPLPLQLPLPQKLLKPSVRTPPPYLSPGLLHFFPTVTSFGTLSPTWPLLSLWADHRWRYRLMQRSQQLNLLGWWPLPHTTLVWPLRPYREVIPVTRLLWQRMKTVSPSSIVTVNCGRSIYVYNSLCI